MVTQQVSCNRMKPVVIIRARRDFLQLSVGQDVSCKSNTGVGPHVMSCTPELLCNSLLPPAAKLEKFSGPAFETYFISVFLHL